MAAVAEAAEVVGARDLDDATGEQLAKAWGLVRRSADLSREELAARIASEAGLDLAVLDDVHPAAPLLPGRVARWRTIMPVSCTDREIVVATANPLSQAARREVAELTGRTVRFQVAPPFDILAALDTAYPDVDDGSAPLPPSEPRDRGGEGPRILVVDDEAGQRTLFRSILEEGGFRVDVARDGQAALEALATDPDYDLVTLDYWMDRMNGLRVLQHLRNRPDTADVAVIMVTGADDRQIEMSLFEAGADDYVAKPIDGPLFLLRVRAVLRRRLHA